MPFNCNCKLKFNLIKQVVKHSYYHFKYDPIKINCCVCGLTQASYQSYRKHVRNHEEVGPRKHFRDFDPINKSFMTTTQSEDGPHKESLGQTDDVNERNVQPSYSSEFAILLIGLKEKYSLPDSVTNIVAEAVLQIAEKVFSSETPIITLRKLRRIAKSTYLQNKLLNEHLPIVKPIEIVLSNGVYHYIPMYETLTHLLNNNNVLNVMDKRTVTLDDRVNCYSDGTIFKSRNDAENQLRIILSIDDFGPTCPLGAGHSRNKLCGIYFTIDNLPYHFQSKRNNINLAMLVNRDMIKENGLRLILRPLINDLKRIEEEGVPVKSLMTETMQGYLSLVCGDNLGMHEIFGLSLNFNSGYICRWCYATYDEIQVYPLAECYERRTIESYQKDIENGLAFNSMQKSRGQKNEHVFCEMSLDITCCVPPDIMHDIPEGIILKLLVPILRNILSTAPLVEKLNHRLSETNWSDGRVEKLKYGDIKLKGTASQILDFCVNLPSLIGEDIQSNDPFWLLYLNLRKVISFSYCESIHFEWLKEMRQDIQSLLTTFKALFPTETMTPKLHYISHYPDLIKQFGPLLFVSSLRFERKHQPFKQLAKKIQNTRNLTLSLSKRHQRNQAVNRQQILDSTVYYKKLKDIDFELIPQSLMTLLHETDLSAYSQTKSVTTASLSFVCDTFYALSADTNSLFPVFGKITNIFISEDNVIIVAKIYKATEFISHYFAYNVTETESFSIFEPSCLLSTKVLKPFLINDCFFLSKFTKLTQI